MCARILKKKEKNLVLTMYLLHLYVLVEADVQIIVPFTTEVTTVKTRIMIDKHLVMGQVPNFYGGGKRGHQLRFRKRTCKIYLNMCIITCNKLNILPYHVGEVEAQAT